VQLHPGAAATPRAPSARGVATERETGGSSSGRGKARKPDLKKDLRDFASGRPQGWGHEDWLNFLENLKERGHNIGDREAIGMALEKERLDLALSDVKGVGPQRRKALVERFGTVWSLRNADPEDIASVGGLPQNLAVQIKSAMH
jgi:excinuclease ABC subunit C